MQLAPNRGSLKIHEKISGVITHLVGKPVQHTEDQYSAVIEFISHAIYCMKCYLTFVLTGWWTTFT